MCNIRLLRCTNLNPLLNGVVADVTRIDKIKKKPNRQALSETSEIRGRIISSSVHNTRTQHCTLQAFEAEVNIEVDTIKTSMVSD